MRSHIAIEPPEEHHGTVAYEQDWNAGLGRKRKNGGKKVATFLKPARAFGGALRRRRGAGSGGAERWRRFRPSRPVDDTGSGLFI